METTLQLTPEKILFNKIENWADKNNFFAPDGATAIDQIIKLNEEMGELSKHHLRDKNIEDDLGDMLVVLVILSRLTKTSIENISFDAILDYCDKTSYFKNEENTMKNQILELGQLYGGLCTTFLNKENVSAHINVLFTSLVITARMAGTSLLKCGNIAYTEIEPRKGKFINGAFVKEADLNQ